MSGKLHDFKTQGQDKSHPYRSHATMEDTKGFLAMSVSYVDGIQLRVEK